jgi:hypothetical protein
MQVLLYHKVAKSYYTFLEAVCHNHTSFLVQQNHDKFVVVLQSLQLGIKSIDVTTSSQCSMAIDNLATWLHQNLIKVDDLHKVHPAAQVSLPHNPPLGSTASASQQSSSERHNAGSMQMLFCMSACCNVALWGDMLAALVRHGHGMRRAPEGRPRAGREFV